MSGAERHGVGAEERNDDRDRDGDRPVRGASLAPGRNPEGTGGMGMGGNEGRGFPPPRGVLGSGGGPV